MTIDQWFASCNQVFHAKFEFFSIVLPNRIRVDKGTETGTMATMHCFLRDKNGDLPDATESILYGPSTENKIERWWRELLERMEKFFKVQLSTLVEDGDYDSSDELDRYHFITKLETLSNSLNERYIFYL